MDWFMNVCAVLCVLFTAWLFIGGAISRLYRWIRCGGHNWQYLRANYRGNAVYECAKCGDSFVRGWIDD